MNEELGRVIREAPLHTILIARVGSKAYGISNPDSDTDYNGIYIIPLGRFLSSCGHGADTIVRHKEPDGTFHDVAKFCRLAAATESRKPMIMSCRTELARSSRWPQHCRLLACLWGQYET